MTSISRYVIITLAARETLASKRTSTRVLAIIVGNLHGFRMGEWRGAGHQSIRWIVAAIAILVLGVCVLAQGIAMGQ